MPYARGYRSRARSRRDLAATRCARVGGRAPARRDRGRQHRRGIRRIGSAAQRAARASCARFEGGGGVARSAAGVAPAAASAAAAAASAGERRSAAGPRPAWSGAAAAAAADRRARAAPRPTPATRSRCGRAGRGRRGAQRRSRSPRPRARRAACRGAALRPIREQLTAVQARDVSATRIGHGAPSCAPPPLDETARGQPAARLARSTAA